MKNPCVTVIIPTYNRLSLLKEAVESVLRQTFQDYTLVIIDDCSTDGTKEYCQRLIKNHPNIQYHRHDSNQGMVGAWNSGLERATGKYLTLLMSDDVLEKNFLSQTTKVLDQDTKVGLVVVWVDSFRSNPGDTPPSQRYRLFTSSRSISGRDCTLKYLRDKWLVGLPSAILVRKTCFDEFGNFDPATLDPEMWLRINQAYDTYYLDRRLVFWRNSENQDSFTNTQTSEDFYTRAFAVVDYIARYETWKNDAEVQQAVNQAYKKLRLRLLTETFQTKHSLSQLLRSLKMYRRTSKSNFYLGDVSSLLRQYVYLHVIYPLAKFRASHRTSF